MRRGTWGGWGMVPVDGDVVPFSMIDPEKPGVRPPKKKHHYLSVVYMDGFADEAGRVWAYHDEQPQAPHSVRPASIGYRKHYYSCHLEDGTRDDHYWEDLWHCIESVWPETLKAVRDRRLSPAISFNLLGMVAMLRTRVPAARDRNELLLGHKLRTEVQALEANGRLPDELQIYAGALGKVPVGINVEQSLSGMRDEIFENGHLAFRIGFEVLHNRTPIPFITTDNPVCIYDPRVPVKARIPYAEEDEIELLFPIDARTLLRGSSRLRPVNAVVRHRSLIDRAKVREANRTIAQFGYRLYVTQNRMADDLIASHAASVPTIAVEVRGGPSRYQIVWRYRFGPRPVLPPYIDSPEKAARLVEEMRRDGFDHPPPPEGSLEA